MTIEKDPIASSKEDDLQTLVERWTEMSIFSRRTIGAVLSEIIDIMALQADMTAGITDHIKNIDGDHLNQVQRDHMDAIIASTQKEDHLRQRHEHIIAALTVIIESLEHMKKETDDLADIGTGADGYSENWKQRILDAQTLSEVRNKFTEFLQGGGMEEGGSVDSKKEARTAPEISGDIEFF